MGSWRASFARYDVLPQIWDIASPRIYIACMAARSSCGALAIDQVLGGPRLRRKTVTAQVARVIRMFNPTQIVIEAFVSELKLTYERTYGLLEPSYPGVIGFVARLSLESIAGSDAAFAGQLSAIFLADGMSLHRRCVTLPSSYPRGKTVDREPLCKCVLDRA